MVGRTLNHYKILNELGSGGMGEVYLAEDTKLHRQVALKVLSAAVANDTERRARFEREARAVAALNHPNIVTIHSVEEADTPTGSVHFITMELVRGKALSELIPRGGLSLDKLFRLAIPLADAVSAAHEKGITHRDLKPANIMVNEEGRLKILDFGLAKLREEPSPSAPETQLPTQSVTQEGHILGTVAYMSPEQAEGKPVDHRSDIFSLGIILFEMVTGERPFGGDTKISLISSIIKDTPPSLTDVSRVVPRHLARIVSHCLQKDPSRRLQSALDLRNGLEGLKEEVDSGQIAPSAVAELPGKLVEPRNRRWFAVVGLGLVIAAIAYGAYLSRNWMQTARGGPGTPAAGAVSDNSLAVLYFENVADPEDSARMERMTPSLLITALSQSPNLKVVSRQRLHDILRQLGRDSSDAVDRSIGSDVAKKANVRWVVTGEILQMEPNFVLTAEVAEARSGSILASHRVIGRAAEDIFSVVDRLSAELKKGLAPSTAATSAEQRPLAGVTTSSPDAYRHYLDGLDAYYKWYLGEAAESFQKAVELDPTFAMAHYWLSITPGAHDQTKHLEKAMEHLDKVGEKDRRFIRSWYARSQGKFTEAIAELNAIVNADPEEKEAHYRLGRILWNDLWNAEEGVRHFSSVVELDPEHKAAWNILAYIYNAVDDQEKMTRAINRYIELAPDEANPYDSRGELYSFNGQLEQAVAAYERALEIKPDFWPSAYRVGIVKVWLREYSEAERYFSTLISTNTADFPSQGRLGLALIPLHQGKLDRALELLDQGIAADRMEPGYYTFLKHVVKARILEEKQDLDRALSEARKSVELSSAVWTHLPTDRGVEVHLLARSGNLSEAEAVLEEQRIDIDAHDAAGHWLYERAAGLLEWARGDLPQALSHLEEVSSEARGIAPSPELATLYLEMGKLGEAVSEYERVLSRYTMFRSDDPLPSIKAVYQLGVAYEESGWTAKAIEQYEEFLDKWKDADPGIPAVEDARRRLAQLSAKSG